MDKLFITHYFYPGTDPWKNIMLLPEEESFRKAKELADAHPDTTSFGRFADFENYYPARKKADAFVRERFIELDGKPKLRNPYSFTLLECEYLRDWFDSSDKIIIDLDDVPDDQVSFTLGDSCALMIHGNEPVVLTKKMLYERIEACNGSVDVFLKEYLGNYAYVEVQLWDKIQMTNLFSYIWRRSKMSNPWEDIPLSDYENHMSLDSVKQLQAMNSIMKDQFGAYPVDTAMVLGIAGGNGLEHVSKDKYKTVYGVDINADYLKAVETRYGNLAGILKCIKADIINESGKLPEAQLVIANLLIEYVGYEAFNKAMMRVRPQYISCVIQINIDEHQWVSNSPYLHAFDRLDEVHCQMEDEALTKAMKETGYQKILSESYPLPNGKALLRLDFELEK